LFALQKARMRRILPVFIILLIFLSSCRFLNPQVMFKTKKSYPFDNDTTHVGKSEYTISPGDRLEMHFYTIDGFKLVDVTNSVSTTGEEQITYLVEKDSLVKLPIIGGVHLAGLTLLEGEKMLENLYTKYYINPFIQIKITNRHVYVFFADGGKGMNVNILNDNTSIIEVISLAGGLTEYSKAWRIKVIRGDLHNPTIRLIDMSTIEGVMAANLTVRSNDIIYVEAVPNYSTKLFAQITPIIGIITSLLLIITLLKT
jgi:polysaccharide export outer membrane protein